MEKIKYPRSWHLPYSEKPTSDDKKHENDNHFLNKEVVVTIKMDGENTSIYNDYIHARSLSSSIDSEDRRWVDTLRISRIYGNIPQDMRICGENLFYKHTCFYDNLESMFYAFSIWIGNTCLSWDETQLWCDLLDIKHVPIVYSGIYDRNLIFQSFKEIDNKDVEGFVVRLKDEFTIENFSQSLNKYVKKSFVIPDQHWRYMKKTNNLLKDNKNPWELL